MYTNPKLCEITERHVLTEPYWEDLDDNGVMPENDAYMADIFRDQAGYAGTELIRRIVGTSKVKDITSISDEHARAKAEMLCMKAGIAFVKEPEKMTSGSAYTDLLKGLSL
jgi:5-methylthioribose kinase